MLSAQSEKVRTINSLAFWGRGVKTARLLAKKEIKCLTNFNQNSTQYSSRRTPSDCGQCTTTVVVVTPPSAAATAPSRRTAR
jgi:hypothetical protein